MDVVFKERALPSKWFSCCIKLIDWLLCTACRAGTFGEGCGQQCRCPTGQPCHHVSGECDCPGGYTGRACEKRTYVALFAAVYTVIYAANSHAYSWASAHRGTWGQLTPPLENGWKVKKRKHEKEQFSVFMLDYILKAITAGRCRERRYADHIFIQIYFSMHHFVVKFSKSSSPQAAKGHWPP